MFSRLLSGDVYNHIVNATINYGLAGGAIGGSIYGAYIFTDPRRGEPRIRDAIFGSIAGGAIGCGVGGLAVIAHPILLLSPLALGPYYYNKSKTNSELM